MSPQSFARASAGATVAGLAVLALGGCSQIAALAPVGGDAVAEVRYGAIDVLLREDIDVLEAPTCAAGARASVTCSGSTTDGRAIEVFSSTDDDAVLRISLDGHEIFSGPLADVIDEAARG